MKKIKQKKTSRSFVSVPEHFVFMPLLSFIMIVRWLSEQYS